MRVIECSLPRSPEVPLVTSRFDIAAALAKAITWHCPSQGETTPKRSRGCVNARAQLVANKHSRESRERQTKDRKSQAAKDKRCAKCNSVGPIHSTGPPSLSSTTPPQQTNQTDQKTQPAGRATTSYGIIHPRASNVRKRETHSLATARCKLVFSLDVRLLRATAVGARLSKVDTREPRRS